MPIADTSISAEALRGRRVVSLGRPWKPGEHPMKAAKYAPADLDDGFVVAIEIVAKVGEEDAVAKGLKAMVEPSMAEPGMKLFLPYRSPTDRRAFFIFELYVNEQGWAAHQQTDHFKTFVATMLPRLEKRERVPYVPYTAA
jgi:quinol monooxygenase YgiN